MGLRTTTRSFYDPATGTVSYVVWDPATQMQHMYITDGLNAQFHWVSSGRRL